MMVILSKEHIEKHDKVMEWKEFNPNTGEIEFKKNTPERIIQMDKWLKENDPVEDLMN